MNFNRLRDRLNRIRANKHSSDYAVIQVKVKKNTRDALLARLKEDRLTYKDLFAGAIDVYLESDHRPIDNSIPKQKPYRLKINGLIQPKSNPKPWEDHNFGVPAEAVYCLNCGEEIDPRLPTDYCLECEEKRENIRKELIYRP